MKLLLPCLALSAIFVIDNPCTPNDHRRSAVRYFEDGRFDRALVEAKRALRQHGPNSSLYLLSALACIEQNRIEEAFELLGNGLSLEPVDQQMHDALREVTAEVGRYDLGRQILERHLQEQPDDHAARASLGWVYVEQGEEEEGLRLLQAAVKEDNSEIFGYLQLSTLYLKREQVDGAIAVLHRALEMAPSNVRLLLSLGNCELERENRAAASTLFARAFEAGENPSRTAVHIARLYYDSGYRREAIAYYEKAIADDGDNLLALNNLAWTYAEEGIELERALALSLRTVKEDENNVVYLDTYAEILHRAGETSRAIAIMTQALDIEGESGRQYTYLLEQLEKFRTTTPIPESNI